MMIWINQNSLLKLKGFIILLVYYIFLQGELISRTQVLQQQCLQNKGQRRLCVSCIKRQDYQIAEQSTIYIKNNLNEFRVMSMERNLGLECDEIMQLVSYEESMMKADQIKFQEFKAIDEIFQDLGVQVYPVGDRFEIGFSMQIIAVFRIVEECSKQVSFITYSTTKSMEALQIYGSFVSAFSIIVQICNLFISIYLKKFRYRILIMIISNIMILISIIWDDFSFLMRISTIFVFGLYFVYTAMEQKYTVTVVVILGLVQVFLERFYSVGLVLVLLILGLKGRGQEFDRLSNIIGFSMFLLVICAVFEKHGHVLSFPFRRIIEYTVLCLSPILVDIISSSGADREYLQVENEPVSGISLPGYEDQQPIQK